MAVRPLSGPDERSAAERQADYAETTSGGLGGQIFLWIAWAAAAAFWAFGLSAWLGIVAASSRLPANGPGPGEVDAGGIGWLLITVVGGLIALGLALAYGYWRWATRDTRKDAITEAATHAEYDMIEDAGGDDDVSRSPEARRPEQRDAYRAIDPDLRKGRP